MRVQLLMFAFFICIVGTLYSLIDSGIWFGTTQTNFINAVAGINSVHEQSTNSSYTNPSVIMPGAWISAILTMALWNYPYLDNTWGLLLKCFLLFPCSIAVFYSVWSSIIMPVIGVIVTLVSSIAGAIGKLV